MATVRNSFFDRWAASRLGIAPAVPSLAELERLEVPGDLPEGPDSELGGETQSVLDHPTESELRELAELGEEILAELPTPPPGYHPPPPGYHPPRPEQESEPGREPSCPR